MNLKFTHSALTLALASNAVADICKGDGDANVELSEDSSHIDEESVDEKKAALQRWVKQVQSVDADVNEANGETTSMPDVGLLDRRKGRRLANFLFGQRRSARLLQSDEGEEGDSRPCIKPDTCEPKLCECVSEGGKAYDCAAELNNLCNGVSTEDGNMFDVSDCVYEPEYYKKVFCPFAACVVNGGSYVSCECAFYKDYCDIYGDHPDYEDTADTIEKCAIGACCETKEDDDGRAMCFEDAPTITLGEITIGTTASSNTAGAETTSAEVSTTPPGRPDTFPPPAPSPTGIPPTDPTPGGTPPDGVPPTDALTPPTPAGTLPADSMPSDTPPTDSTPTSATTQAKADEGSVTGASPAASKSDQSPSNARPAVVVGTTASLVLATVVWSLLG